MAVIESTSPQQPADVVVAVAEASGAQVAAAVARARLAQRDWAAAAPGTRSAALTAAADAVAAAGPELADLVIREVGKPRTEAAGEVARSVAILRYYAQQVYDPVGSVHESGSGVGLAYTRRRPRGVAGLITPWNFPLAIPLWKAAPALAFGNAVLLKPAPQATACALRLQELLAARLPADVFQVLPGDAAAGRAIVDCVDVVSFTGSAAVGATVAAASASRGVPVQCEMGGQNPAIVLPDADVAAAAAQIAGAAFGYAGQKCTATKRIIVVGESSPFVEALLVATEKLVVGDPADAATVVGPVIDQAARDRVVAATAAAERAGGRVLAGGGALDGTGWFVAPTLLAGLAEDDPLRREEVFGPICAVLEVESAAAAVQVANDVRYGLAAAVYTSDLDRAMQLAEQLAAGQIKVNAPTSGVDFHLPFGGERASSFGPREQGKHAQEFYTSVHTVTIAPAGRNS
jgi:aldehyde dehydrogenase (NAD+)